MSDFGIAKLLSPARNFAIVQLPGRSFPGVVYQGDSLRMLYEQIEAALSAVDREKFAEAQEYLQDLKEQLSRILYSYEECCRQSGLELPYRSRTS